MIIKNEMSNFTLEDQNSEIKFKNNKKYLNVKFNRIAFIFFLFFNISIIYSIHLTHLGSRGLNKLNVNKYSSFDKIQRADIIDRKGNFLAKTVNSIDIGINPVEVIDRKKLLLNLKYIFPNKNYELIQAQLKKDKFFWFEKKISNENYEKIMMLGDKSIKPHENLMRIYPERNLFSHIIGQIDDGNTGISGIEKSLNLELKEKDEPIQLTVDRDIQYLIREELIKFNLAVADSKFVVNYYRLTPDYRLLFGGGENYRYKFPKNMNQREKITDVNFINRATKGVYELGSVFKTFTLAAAFNESIVKPNTEFNNLEKSIRCGNNTISEYDEKIPSNLTAEEILIRSGNIGSVRIGQSIGINKFKDFMKNLDLIETVSFDIDEVGKPIPFKWGKCKLATASYGHGITTTILQLTNAYSIIANGGFKIKPTLIKKKIYPKGSKILNDNVTNNIVPILRKIVTTKAGTASLANVEGYEVAGKTGTAEKSTIGGYSRKKINTFASIFPASDPEYSLVVMLDEPKTNSEYIYNYRDGSGISYKGTPFNTAGWTSVEVVGQIIEKIGPILATKYING